MNAQCPTTEERAIRERIAQAVRAVEPDATVLLYGSRARGDARADSDWDVLVLVDGPVDAGRQDRVYQLLLDLLGETGALVEGLTVSWDDWDSPRWRVLPFHQNVDADGVVLASNGHAVPEVTEDEMAGARQERIQIWLEQAREALDDAEYNAAGHRWRTCVGRLYYAAFYAVSALLLSRGYTFSSHRGVETLFNERFGRTGAVPADLVALYNQLHENRLLADYSGATHFEAAQVTPWIAETRRFLDVVERLIGEPAES